MTPRRWCLGLVLLLLASGLCAQSTHLQKGLELFQQERYEEALREFEEARRLQPSNAAIENALGIASTKLGRLDAANQHYEQALRLNPKLTAAHRNLAVNYLAARQYAPAETHLKLALALEPADPFVHFYLAALYLATARDQDAVAQLAPSGELLANDPAVAIQMVRACLRLNRNDEALALAGTLERRSAISLRDEYDLAALLYAKGLYAPAVERLRRVVKLDPAAWTNRYGLSIALLAAHQPQEAISVLETLSTERPRDPNIFSALGSAYEAAERLPQALEAYQKAVRNDPENPDRYLDYTRVLMDLDRYDESEQFVREGLAVVPDAYALNVRLGSVQMMSAKYDAARASFYKAIELHPDIAVAYAGVAQSYFKEGRHEEAVKVLETARAKVPRDFAIEYYYGLALVRLNRNQEAVSAFERAVPLNPAALEPRYELGKCYFALDRLDAARAQFEQVIRLAPRYANAYYQLSRIYARTGDAAQAREMALRTRELKTAQREAGLAAQKARRKGFEPAPEP
jgi:tetratricopeptide (TPR) repeat protein